MLRTLIIIPAFNMEGNIEKVVNNLTDKFSKYDYLVINNGSTDHTQSICNKNKYHVVNLVINMRISSTVQTGYQYARDNNYGFAVWTDNTCAGELMDVIMAYLLICYYSEEMSWLTGPESSEHVN